MKRLLTVVTTLLVTLSASLTMRAQINVDQAMRIGQNALYFDDYVVSIQYFNQVIQVRPYMARPYFLRSIAKLNLEDYLGAEQDATDAIERNPFLTDAYEVRGVARQNRGNSAGAVEDYNKALELLPDNRSLLFNKALAQEDIKDYDGATLTYQRLLKLYPRFENGYLGRARLQLSVGDTIAARQDLDHALSIDKNLAGAYVMRAEISIKTGDSLQVALGDLNEAIKLQPKQPGLYINRAYLRYKLDDFRGALDDYETSITLDPVNPVAYFNRGLLRMESLDNDRALADFSQVLQIDPDDYRALYNRAMIYTSKGDYDNAIRDIDRVVEAFPDFAGAVYTRFTIYNDKGDRRNAMRDYDKAMAMFKEDRKRLQQQSATSTASQGAMVAARQAGDGGVKGGGTATAVNDAEDIKEETAADVARRFSTLLTIDTNIEVDEEHNNKSIRGRVQDRNQAVVTEPMFRVSYYADEDAVNNSAIYNMPELVAVNALRALRQQLVLTLHDVGASGEDDIAHHFQSVEYYNSYIATHAPRAIDYFGRGMDFMMLHNYSAAEEDFGRALAMNPDFTLAYLLRADARYRQFKTSSAEGGDTAGTRPSQVTAADRLIGASRMHTALSQVVADIDCVISLAPRTAIAWYNKGCVLIEMNDIDGAIESFTRAIELNDNLGAAYYNRGYLYMQRGDSRRGSADLSRAGELGIVQSYNLLKRMNR